MKELEKLLTIVALGYTPARGLTARMARELLDEEPASGAGERRAAHKEHGQKKKEI